MDKILKYDDLMSISTVLAEAGHVYDNVTIEIGIHTKKMLNRINDDFFFRSGMKDDERINDVNEINISMNGVKFKYVCTEQDTEGKNE